MKSRSALRLAARAVGTVSVLYIGVFALDAFGPGVPAMQATFALLIHLIPAALLALLLAFAWRNELAGGIAYLAVSLLPFALLSNLWWVNATLSAPFLLAGVLFLLAARRA